MKRVAHGLSIEVELMDRAFLAADNCKLAIWADCGLPDTTIYLKFQILYLPGC